MTGNFKCDIHCAATTANGRMSADPPAAPPPVLTESARIKAYIARLERDGIARVKMFIVITIAYLIFWGPLFLVTLFSYGDYKTETPSTSHEASSRGVQMTNFFLKVSSIGAFYERINLVLVPDHLD